LLGGHLRVHFVAGHCFSLDGQLLVKFSGANCPGGSNSSAYPGRFSASDPSLLSR
jgi:hypothetical protein